MDRPEKRRESTEPGQAPFDVLRQLSGQPPMESQSLPTQEPWHPLVAGESPHTQEPSQSQPDHRCIHDLAVRFVQSVQEGTKIQGLHLTDPQYREVQKALALMKERQAIAPDTYTKARQKAYQISDKGREAKKLYNISNKCKETKKLYHTSDKYKEAKKRHNASDKGKETFKRYFASKKAEKPRNSTKQATKAEKQINAIKQATKAEKRLNATK